MESLKVLNLSGCLKLHKLPESLSFGLNDMIQRRRWTSKFLADRSRSRLQLPQSSVLSSLTGLQYLRDLDLSYCNISEVPDSIGSLSRLEYLILQGNKFSSLPRTGIFSASGCTSLRELPERLNLGHVFLSCILMGFPESYRNLTIHEIQGSTSQALLLDSSIISNGSKNQFFSLLHYMALQIDKRGIFPAQGDHVFPDELDILYHGNSIPQWFTNQSKGNHVNVDLPSDWCYSSLRGVALCVVYSSQMSSGGIGYDILLQYCIVNNFNGAHLGKTSGPLHILDGSNGRCELDRIWLSYIVPKCFFEKAENFLEKAENFVTFTFPENGCLQMKECGVRFVYDEDIEKGIDPSMIQDIPLPTKDGADITLKNANESQVVIISID